MDYRRFIQRKSQHAIDSGFDPLWMPDFLYDFQKYLVNWSICKGRSAIFADCGMGKGQPAESLVLTPTGWRKIGELCVGDRIISSSGTSSNVIGVYPKPEQDTYRVHFSDGVSFVVDLEHLHICRTNNDRQRGNPWRVMSTSELLSCGNLRYGASGKSRNYDIPVVSDVEFDNHDLPIDPYVLGVLLGDGYFGGNVQVSSIDSELLNEVQSRLPDGVSLSHAGRCNWRIKTGLTGNKKHKFRQCLEDFGLLSTRSDTKFVPDLYLMANPLDRLMLLRGLMDTDGYVAPGGTCQFYSVSHKLASDVVFLLRSLGGIPTTSLKETSCNGKPGLPCYVVTFSLATHNPFSLPRKSERWNPSPRDNGRWIDRIEFEKRQPTVCIKVDSSDSSYVTENFIVTHNTAMQLVWAENVVRHTNKPVLIATPLAVGHQTVGESEKFGVEAVRTRDGVMPKHPCVCVTNYEQLHKYDPDHFGGIVCDESSGIKDFKSQRKKVVVEFSRLMNYRLLCTATAAPNDYWELGTSSEALGYLGFRDMITTFFKQETSKDHLGWGRTKYRFRGHAEQPFWSWVCSWAMSIRKPSDLGFASDEKFVLPGLNEVERIVQTAKPRGGMLFTLPAKDMREERAERRHSLNERCELAAELAMNHDGPSALWVGLNPEGDLLEKMLTDCVQVSGSMSDDAKEEAFTAFSTGQVKRIITKPKIGAWGLNWQHCSNVISFPTHSYEQYYQLLRRFYRYGQKNVVNSTLILCEGEEGILKNLKRKQRQADKMFDSIVKHMSDSMHLAKSDFFPDMEVIPQWL